MLQTGEEIIWEGTTWPMGICSPLCCSSVKWKITNKRVDYVRGCCGSTESTLDVRRITDLQFHRGCFQLLLGRGTLTIFSDDRTDPQINISSFGMKRTYRKLREEWLRMKNVPTVVTTTGQF
ncbi:hypothetical protein RclHR1_04580007 [Rhizophagus clarus]|nr:hypothetical protein RclHR1_04580007 [Rhizophagus clarus]